MLDADFARYERIKRAIPAILLRELRRHERKTRAIYDLGAGTMYGDFYEDIARDVREVWIVDPVAKYHSTARRPVVHVHREVSGVPVGLPAIACHPGFSLPPERFATYLHRETMPTWKSTLDALRPSWIAWCAWSPEEFGDEISWLGAVGYDLVAHRLPEESKTWSLLGDYERFCAVVGVARRR